MQSPSFGGRGRFADRPLHVVTRTPYRPTLAHSIPRSTRGRANRRRWLIEHAVLPLMIAIGALMWVALTLWQHHNRFPAAMTPGGLPPRSLGVFPSAGIPGAAMVSVVALEARQRRSGADVRGVA